MGWLPGAMGKPSLLLPQAWDSAIPGSAHHFLKTGLHWGELAPV